MPRYTAPPRNNAYVAMLGLAVFSMAFACALLGLELSGYDPATPPAFQAVTLPKVEPKPAPPPAGTPPAGAPVAPGGGAAKLTPATPPPAPVAIAPPPLPAPPPPVVAKAEPPKVEVPKPDDPSKRGPRPGFNLAAPTTVPQQP